MAPTSRGETVATRATPDLQAGATTRGVAGVVLAGGRSTRLGLLAARPDKITLLVDEQPILIRHLRSLAAARVDTLGVVISPELAEPVRALLERGWPQVLSHLRIVEQPRPLGPGDALALAAQTFPDRMLLVLLADTIVDALPAGEGDWVGVAAPPTERRWCCVTADAQRRVLGVSDGRTGPGDLSATVAVGLYRFGDPELLRRVCREATLHAGTELEISAILGPYADARETLAVPIESWRDCGDLASHAALQRGSLKTRSGQAIQMTSSGYLRKSGRSPAFRQQTLALQSGDPDQQALFPRVVAIAPDLCSYTFEYVALPTLAELFLYRNGSAADWSAVLTRLIETVDDAFWRKATSEEATSSEITSIYVHQIESRWSRSPLPGGVRSANELVVNGRAIAAGDRAVTMLVEQLRQTSISRPGQMHGDLHFSNVLYSPGHDYFRLLDPRGGLGVRAGLGDAYYDAAKLRHSYSGMYDAILHGLYAVSVSPEAIHLEVFPRRATEAHALDEVLSSRGFELERVKLLEGLLLLGCSEFHVDDPKRMLALYVRGLLALDQLSSGVAGLGTSG